MKSLFQYAALCLICFALSGCLVTSAVDLAATTVFTAGKLAVKGTGALINAAIPDGKKDKDKKDKKDKKDQKDKEHQQNQPAASDGDRDDAAEYRMEAE